MAVEVHQALIIECVPSTKAGCPDTVSAQGLVIVQDFSAAEAQASLLLGERLLSTGKFDMMTRSPSFRSSVLTDVEAEEVETIG